jgi:abortive infection bacteriophage resistance protein
MKTAKTIPEQIEKLNLRGLKFEDEAKAEYYLLKYNYYRLSGYWWKYQKKANKKDGDKEKDNDKDENFVDNTTLEKIIAIYKLDAKLRNLILEGIEIFEVCFRTRFAYYIALSELDKPYLYFDRDSYKNVKATKKKKHKTKIASETNPNSHDGKVANKKKYKNFYGGMRNEIDRSEEIFINHYKKKEDGKIPIWVVVEVLSFGTISQMYSRWKNKETVKKISASFNFFEDYESSINTIGSLVFLRNLCAHQSRIWNRKLIKKINNKMIYKILNKVYLREIKTIPESSPWRVISILMALVDEINKDDTYSTRVMELFKNESNEEFDKKLYEEFYEGLINPTL